MEEAKEFKGKYLEVHSGHMMSTLNYTSCAVKEALHFKVFIYFHFHPNLVHDHVFSNYWTFLDGMESTIDSFLMYELTDVHDWLLAL